MRVRVFDRDGIRELRLDDPPGNVLDSEACGDLAAAIRERTGDPHLKAFLFTAAGRHFSYGASVPEHEAQAVESFLPRFHSLFVALADASVPAVAAVRGLCLGGALELAAFCHFVVAEQGAEFGAPEIRLGVFPPLACLLLPWRCGRALAEDLILTGRRLPAAEAERKGLVSRLCEPSALEAAVEEFLAREIAPRSAAALRLAVRAVRAVRGGLNDALRERLPRLEQLYLEDVMATHDAREGLRAFLEKRAPVFRDE
ncbi:MAG: enoyl-CoA hydratase/isomerase family protein [Planctomycetaceae bacterium]